MRRVFCESIPSAGSCVLGEAEGRHLTQVLRSRVGDPIELLDGRGTRAAATVAAIGRRGRETTVDISHVAREAAPLAKIALYVGTPRGKAMSRVVRYATELGVWRIQPIECEFGTAKPDELNLPGWHVDGCEAAKQSGNSWLPDISEPQTFSAAVANTAPGFVAAVPAGGIARPQDMPLEGLVSVWVGPEGGFSAAETATLLDRGLVPVSVGAWILRVETAVCAVLGAVLSRH